LENPITKHATHTTILSYPILFLGDNLLLVLLVSAGLNCTVHNDRQLDPHRATDRCNGGNNINIFSSYSTRTALYRIILRYYCSSPRSFFPLMDDIYRWLLQHKVR